MYNDWVALKTSPFLKGFLLNLSGFISLAKGPLRLRRFFHEVKKKNMFLEVSDCLVVKIINFYCHRFFL